MNFQRTIHNFFVSVLTVALGSTAFADSAVVAVPQVKSFTLEAGPQSELHIDGTSTLHAYHARSSRLAAVLEINVSADAASDDEGLIQAIATRRPLTLDVHVPVASLQSGDEDLDRNMHAALKGDAHPTISFRLDTYTATPASERTNAFIINAKGFLRIAGKEQLIAITPKVVVDKGGLNITGSAAINMQDFGIEPPTFLFGAIKADTEIVVYFNVVMLAAATRTASK